MNSAKVQITSWLEFENCAYDNLSLKLGDKVIVKVEHSHEIGTVVGFSEGSKDSEDKKGEDVQLSKNANDTETTYKITRKANTDDFKNIIPDEDKDKAIKKCKEYARAHELPMKLVDVDFSIDQSKITFAFIAEGRVDFRNLVKDLTRHFNKTVRLQQIGIRDEAKINGDYGHCGRQLCCKNHLVKLDSITSEMAEAQQCVHRGSDRISGVCGRLMCCLAYEIEGYAALSKKMPPIGARVNVDGKKGIIVSQHYLKQSVGVEFKGEKNGDKTVVEIDLNRHKKKQ